MPDYEKQEEQEVKVIKKKQPVSALEKYGYLNPKALREAGYDPDDPDDDDDNQDYDDVFDTDIADDLVDNIDVDQDDGGNEEDEAEATDEEEEASATDSRTTAQEDLEAEVEDVEETSDAPENDDEDYFDEDGARISGDWQVLSAKGSGEGSSSDEMEEEARLERRARRLSKLAHKKDILIAQYLTVMKHVKKLKKHNMFLEDHLYQICIRKKLINEGETKRSTSLTSRTATKLKRQKKKQAAKMQANYEDFVNYRPPIVWSVEGKKIIRKKTRKALNRARKLVFNVDPRPPKYKRKMDTRVISLKGFKYQRMFQSKTRNWVEVVKHDATQTALHEMKANQIRRQQNAEIRYGHPDAPKSRTLVKFIERPAKSKKNLVESGRRKSTDKSPSKKTSCGGKCRDKGKSLVQTQSLRKRKKRKGTSKSASQLIFSKAKNSLASTALDKLRRKSSANSNEVKRQYSSTSSERIRRAVRKLNCKNMRKHKKQFRELHWFDSAEKQLKGRKYSGNKIHSAEKQHLINFVNATQLNISARKKANKVKAQREKDNIASEWNDAIKRLHQLIVRKNDLDKEHKKTLQQKFIDWGFWEERSLLAVEGLLNLFKTFVQQSYFTRWELRTFNQDAQEFEQQLRENHQKLLNQLLKMYKSRMSLLIIQRKLKDTANQTLCQQGFSIGDYEQLFNENKTLYEQIHIREQRIELQHEKLKKIMKSFVLFRDLKAQAEKSVVTSSNRRRVVLEEAWLKREDAVKVMDALSLQMKRNKGLLLQAALVEKPLLLRDCSTRKSVIENLEAQKRTLSRDVYLKERELNIIQVKTVDVKRNIKLWKSQDLNSKTQAELRSHQAKLNGRLSGMISTTLNKCGYRREDMSRDTIKPASTEGAWK